MIKIAWYNTELKMLDLKFIHSIRSRCLSIVLQVKPVPPELVYSRSGYFSGIK